jgi:phosphate transport system protein
MEQHFHREMKLLRKRLADMGGMVEGSIARALACLETGDRKLFHQIITDESRVDELEVEIEESCLKILALYHPVAKDLRLIITILKVINELESIGDLALRISEQALKLPAAALENSKLNIEELGSTALKMVRQALDSLLQEEVTLAKDVKGMEDRIDLLHRKNQQLVAQQITEKTLQFTTETLTILSLSRSFERIGDIATNIAQDVIYLVDAKIVRHNWED